MIDLRCGDWREVLRDVEAADAVIVDAPYSEKTHTGHNYTHAIRAGKVDRRELNYKPWTARDVGEFCSAWSRLCRGWIVSLTDDVLAPAWQESLSLRGRYVFAPLPFVSPGSRVRLAGDGPSSWTCWIVVARPVTKAFSAWGTLPGAYVFPPERMIVPGGKPLTLMRAIVRDYSRPGDLIVDPCAGGATTLIAADIEGRNAIGAEQDPETYRKAMARIEHGYRPEDARKGEQIGLLAGARK